MYPHPRLPWLTAFAVSGLVLVSLASAAASVADKSPAQKAVDVLQRRCFQCHGTAKMSGLDLRTRETALAGGQHGKGIVPGKPEASAVYTFVSGRGSRPMPPNGPLPAAEQEVLRRWIQAGAEWPGESSAPKVWWSLKPLRRPEQPRVRDRSWVRNPIDAFVLARLEAKGLRPAPPAGRRELIRRVYFDLTGLPPAPEEVQQFLADRSPDAYEKVIDRLLASPRYGERWARHWLDVARFAESQGFERDKIRDHAWRYRDYVIRSLNEDKPYHRFVREQVAGDVLPDATRETTIATGFLVAGPYDEVGNQQASAVMKQRVREDELEDMVAATCQTFLGLTVNCARCHDHKFDPIPQADYYRIQAALAAVRPGDRDLLTSAEREARDRDVTALDEKLTGARGRLVELDRAVGQRIARERSPEGAPPGPAPRARWTFESGMEAQLKLAGGASVAGGRLKLDGKDDSARLGPLPFALGEKTLEAWVAVGDLGQKGGSVLTVENEPGTRFDGIVFAERQPRRWMAGSDAFLRTRDVVSTDEAAPADQLLHLAISYARDGHITLYRNGKPLAAAYNGGPLLELSAGQAYVLFGLRHTAAGAAAGGPHWFKGEIEEARLYDRALSAAEIEASFRSGPAVVTEEEIRKALTAEERERRTAITTEVERLQQEIKRVGAPLLAYATKEGQTAPTVRVLKRGDVNQPAEAVSAGGLSCVAGLTPLLGVSPEAPDADRRRKLADWLVSPRNPLTPRVLVNRIWQHHFGRGIVGTPNDFGVNGEPPTHPELLDWLAATFVAKDEGGRMKAAGGSASLTSPRSHSHTSTRSRPSPTHPNTHTGLNWSPKSLHRLILLSNAYRQSDRFNPAAAAVDAENRLLWRFPPRRLEAEAVRDAMLAVSGQLNLEEGGPGFRPFSVLEANAHFYTVEDRVGPEYNRRSIYRTVVNSGGVPLLEALDCPDPSVKTPRRGSTTTPLQALALLNNSFVLRQAREMAARVEKEAGPEVPRRVDRAYQLALGRSPNAGEGGRAVSFVRAHGLAAFCRVLLNSSEFVYVR